MSHVVYGAAAGCIILGLGGRLAMALVSLLTPLPLGLTLRGTLAIVVTGGVYGVVGAGVDWLARRWLRGRKVARAGVGLVLFVVIAVVSASLNQVSAAWLYPVLTVACFLPLALGFAMVLVARWP